MCIRDSSEINVDGYGLHAIYAEGDLTVRGNDDLVVRTTSASSSVIYVYRGDINLEDNVFLEVYPEGHVLYVDEARGSDGVVNICLLYTSIRPDVPVLQSDIHHCHLPDSRDGRHRQGKW